MDSERALGWLWRRAVLHQQVRLWHRLHHRAKWTALFTLQMHHFSEKHKDSATGCSLGCHSLRVREGGTPCPPSPTWLKKSLNHVSMIGARLFQSTAKSPRINATVESTCAFHVSVSSCMHVPQQPHQHFCVGQWGRKKQSTCSNAMLQLTTAPTSYYQFNRAAQTTMAELQEGLIFLLVLFNIHLFKLSADFIFCKNEYE